MVFSLFVESFPRREPVSVKDLQALSELAQGESACEIPRRWESSVAKMRQHKMANLQKTNACS